MTLLAFLHIASGRKTMNAIIIALALAVPQQQFNNENFVTKFDEAASLSAGVTLLIEEGFQNGFEGIRGVFTPGEPVGELKQSFGNGLRQIRLSSGLSYDKVRDNISVTKTSVLVVRSEYQKSHYDQGFPSLIDEIRKYVDKASCTVMKVTFTGKQFEKLTPWYVLVVLDKEEKWRVDSVFPQLPA